MKQGRAGDFFSRPEVMVVFTTAPAGLGHVRVTEALREGLDESVRAEVVGLEDASTQFLHRVASRNRFLRSFMEFTQNNPLVELGFTALYRKRLRRQGEEAFRRLIDLVKRRRPKPTTLVIVATHHSLAHQVAAIKNQLAKDLKLCVMLVVVVTDDSPQKIWGVIDADLLIVPSLTTKEGLERYMVMVGGNIPEVVVLPYPVSKDFCRLLSAKEYAQRRLQVNPRSKEKIKVVIPISGAAVQLKYFEDIISTLGKSGLADISVVSRESQQTKRFLGWCQEQPAVRVIAEAHDRDVVLCYEKEYRETVFAVEITKPSEQSFKALCTPKQRGGVILAFSEPVGRQEDDNLALLARHELTPSPRDREIIERFLRFGERRLIDTDFLEQAEGWRGFLLPLSGKEAGRAILKLRQVGVLAAMVDFKGFMDHSELRSDGVVKFWRVLGEKAPGRTGPRSRGISVWATAGAYGGTPGSLPPRADHRQ